MDELIKKVLYTGVGLVASTTEKMQQTVNDLVDKEKISKDEGQKIVNNFKESAESKRTEMEDRIKEMMDAILNRFDLVRKDDIQDLVRKVEKMEKEMRDRDKK